MMCSSNDNACCCGCVTDSKLSLPGRAELQKLGPPALPLCALGRFDLVPVGAEALNMSAMSHAQG
jgi:hypothetical protein